MLVRGCLLWSWGRSFPAVLPSGATLPFPHHYLLAYLSAPLSTDQPILLLAMIGMLASQRTKLALRQQDSGKRD